MKRVKITTSNVELEEFLARTDIEIINVDDTGLGNENIPAWSLDRLKELYKCVGDTSPWNLNDVNYDRLIQCIGLAIKHNSFNKEHLI